MANARAGGSIGRIQHYDFTSLVVQPHAATARAAPLVCCLLAWLLSLEKRVWISPVPAIISPTSMASSPLSVPGSPRPASPLSSEGDVARPISPSHDDAHTVAMQRETEIARANHPVASTAASPPPTAPKGKEKAAKGPLRLLDLPMDILKEIIHQVRATSMQLHHSTPMVEGEG